MRMLQNSNREEVISNYENQISENDASAMVARVYR